MPRHLPVLDGLRGVAVLLVLWCHVPLAIPGYPGWLGLAHFLIGPASLGVEIFFVLSGFLITRILIAERDQGTPVRWFLLRRACRIFPIYYLLLLVLLPSQRVEDVAWSAVYLHNLHAILWPELTPFSHMWSLCVEEHFYLLWPPVVAFCRPATARRVLVFGVMPFAVVGAVVVGVTVHPDYVMNAVQHGSPFRFFSLGAGCLMAMHETRLFGPPRHGVRLALVCFAIALALHPLLWFVIGPWWTGGAWLPGQLLQPVWLLHNCALGTAILASAVLWGTARWSPLRLLSMAPLRAVGRISYGLYLYHWPIYWAVVWHQPTAACAALAVGLTFAAATASYWVVERPILRYASRWRGSARPAAATAAIAGMADAAAAK